MDTEQEMAGKIEFWREKYREQHQELLQSKLAFEGIVECIHKNKDSDKESQQLAFSACAYLAKNELKKIAKLLKLENKRIHKEDDYIIVGGAKCYTGKRVKS